MIAYSIKDLERDLENVEDKIDSISSFVYSNAPADNPFMEHVLNLMMEHIHSLMDYRDLLSKILKEEQKKRMKEICFNENEIKAISDALDEYVFEHGLDDLPMHENGVYYGDNDIEECDAKRMNAIQSVYDKLYRRN